MAEALVAIGLVANIIQFVCFGFTLVSKTKELHESASGALNENVELSVVSQDINTFRSVIRSSTSSSTQLSDIAQRSEAIAGELLGAITKLQHKQHTLGSGKAPTKWRSFRKALECIWDKPHIEELRVKLERLRDQVMLHLSLNTRDKQIQLIDLLKDWKEQNMKADYGLTAQLQDLDTELQGVRDCVSNLHGDHYWKRLDDCFSRFSSEVHLVSRRHGIIASLRYEGMQLRQSAIKDAHSKTFAWIYGNRTPETPVSRPNTGFAQWLRRGDGMYWITGKPGSGKSTLMKYLYDHDDTIRNLRTWSGKASLVRAPFYFWLPGQQMQKSLEGLLQTLLYHILFALPELVPTICPERWHAASQPQPNGVILPDVWTLSELQKSFVLFRAQSISNTKFYFHVDGLDEYYGDSWDVIETLRNLSSAPNVKLCLSSRPWNCFQDSFGKGNANFLRLHDFTRPDIELFARESLFSSDASTDIERNSFDDLIRDIGERAQGVFLWVRLVVRSLRNGIINEDPVSILQERLRAIPSDLEDFFEQMILSVEVVYRRRMASTFLAAIRSPRQLKLIHYYFLDQDYTDLGFDMPSKTWKRSRIQKCALQAKRRLNGRFKGLLEAASTVEVSAQTRVDLLHRTLSDFLATKRMRERLESWASREPNVYTAISRALIAESKFIETQPSPSTLKLAVELASQGAVETGITVDCFEIIDQAELENERTRLCHTTCGLNCDIIRFAASIGHAEYLKYRVHKDGDLLDLNHILKHAIKDDTGCPDPDETYRLCLPSHVRRYGTPRERRDRSVTSVASIDGTDVVPSLVKQLFDLGVDPNFIVDGASNWIRFAGTTASSIDGDQKDQYWDVLEMFLEQGVDVNLATGSWISMLTRTSATVEENPRNTLRYFKRLFSRGLNPNFALRGTTLTTVFLRTLGSDSLHLPIASQRIKHDLLREFLRYGAAISPINQDTMFSNDGTPCGWYQAVRQHLGRYHQTTVTALVARSSQYRIFLEHGLDPNIMTHCGSTLWVGFLEAMTSVVEKGAHDSRFGVPLYDIILASLQYGADPHVPTIKQLLNGSRPFLPLENLDSIHRALQMEISQKESQTQSQSLSQVDIRGASRRGVPGPSKSIPTVARHETRQHKQRGRANLSHSKRKPRSEWDRLS